MLLICPFLQLSNLDHCILLGCYLHWVVWLCVGEFSTPPSDQPKGLRYCCQLQQFPYGSSELHIKTIHFKRYLYLPVRTGSPLCPVAALTFCLHVIAQCCPFTSLCQWCTADPYSCSQLALFSPYRFLCPVKLLQPQLMHQRCLNHQYSWHS